MNVEQLIPFVCSRPVNDPHITCSEPVSFHTQWMSPHSFFLVAVGTLVLDPSAETLYVFVQERRYELPHTSNLSVHLIEDLSSTYTYKHEYCFLQCDNELVKIPDKIAYLYEDLIDLKPHLSIIANMAQTAEQYLFDAIDLDLFRRTTTTYQQTLVLGRSAIEQLDATGEPRVAVVPATRPWKPGHLLVYDSDTTIDACREDTTHNQWDAIAVITTDAESRSGRLQIFLERLLESIEEPVHKALYICMNNTRMPFSERVLGLLNNCKALFASVTVLDLEIPVEEDVYVRDTGVVPTSVPPLGYVSGPNTSFFRTMKRLSNHNTVLSLETDCFFKQGWIPTCDAYVNGSGRFLIAGALYDGKLMWSKGGFINHLNGIAFFKTGSPVFQTFMAKIEQFIRRRIQNGDVSVAYDSAITDCLQLYIDTYMDVSKRHHKHALCCRMFCFWRYIHRMLIHTSHIVNVSVKEDNDMSFDFLEDLYDYAIVHKKDAYDYSKVLFSFSLYGTAEKYARGMLENCGMIGTRFRGASVHVYCADNVPPSVISALRFYKHVTVIPVPTKPGIENMFDRLLACDQPGASHVFVRDADSRVHERDAACIDDFLASNKSLHVVRDHEFHKRRVMGGMFGLRVGTYNMTERLEAWTQPRIEYQADQDFLSKDLYEALKDSVLVHDRYHTFSDETVTPFHYPIEDNLFVGQVHSFKDGAEYTEFMA